MAFHETMLIQEKLMKKILLFSIPITKIPQLPKATKMINLRNSIGQKYFTNRKLNKKGLIYQNYEINKRN